MQLSRKRKKDRKNAVAAVESVEKWARWTSYPLFHRPFGAKKRKMRRRSNASPTTKSPLKKLSENGDRKRKKRTKIRVYSSKFSPGRRVSTSSAGAMRLGRPFRTMRVRWMPLPRRKRPYLANCWRVMPRSASSPIR